jgi:heme exporter protein CcmD
MDFGAPHTGFVIAAYSLSAAVLIGLVLKTILSLKALQRELGLLETRRGPRRKSQQ